MWVSEPGKREFALRNLFLDVPFQYVTASSAGQGQHVGVIDLTDGPQSAGCSLLGTINSICISERPQPFFGYTSDPVPRQRGNAQSNGLGYFGSPAGDSPRSTSAWVLFLTDCDTKFCVGIY